MLKNGQYFVVLKIRYLQIIINVPFIYLRENDKFEPNSWSVLKTVAEMIALYSWIFVCFYDYSLFCGKFSTNTFKIIHEFILCYQIIVSKKKYNNQTGVKSLFFFALVARKPADTFLSNAEMINKLAECANLISSYHTPWLSTALLDHALSVSHFHSLQKEAETDGLSQSHPLQADCGRLSVK